MAETPTPLPVDPLLNSSSDEPETPTVDSSYVSEVSEPVVPSSSDEPTTTHSENVAESTTQDSNSTTSSTSSSLPTDEQITEAMRGIMKGQDTNTITLRMLVEQLGKKFEQDLSSKKTFIKETIPVLLQEIQEQNGEGEGEDDAEAEEEAEAEGEEKGDAEDKEEETLNLSGEDVAMQKLLLEQIKFGGGRVTRGRANGRAPPKPLKPKKRKSTDNEGEEEEPQKKKKKGTSRTNKPKNLSPALAEFIGENKMTRPDVVKRLHEYIKANDLQDPKNKKRILLDEKLQLVFKRKTTDYFKLNTLLSSHLTDPGELL